MPGDTIIGFDGTADDVSVVVMTRDNTGTWQVRSSSGGPDTGWLAARIADLAAEHRPDENPLSEQVRDWLATLAGRSVALSDEQVELMHRWYGHPVDRLRLPRIRL